MRDQAEGTLVTDDMRFSRGGPGEVRQARSLSNMAGQQCPLLAAACVPSLRRCFAHGGSSSLTVDGTDGHFGLVHAKQSWRRPAHGGHGGRYLVCRVRWRRSRLASHTVMAVDGSLECAAQGVAADSGVGCNLWVTKFSRVAQRLALPSTRRGCGVYRLDAGCSARVARKPDSCHRLTAATDASVLAIRPFALARSRLG